MKIEFKKRIKRMVPPTVYRALRIVYNWKDLIAVGRFLAKSHATVSFSQKVILIGSFFLVSLRVNCPHTQRDILHFTDEILSLDRDAPGVIVEAGCFKGGSTAKFSLVSKLASRRMFVFDSFEGIPDNDEGNQNTIYGDLAGFSKGDFAGSLSEVQNNVAKFGAPEHCEFIEGWFADTMPEFDEEVATAYVDVDLVSSTRDVLVNIFPLLKRGGAIFSQDGHLPLVVQLLQSERFWKESVGISTPYMEGLGKDKIVKIIK